MVSRRLIPFSQLGPRVPIVRVGSSVVIFSNPTLEVISLGSR